MAPLRSLLLLAPLAGIGAPGAGVARGRSPGGAPKPEGVCSVTETSVTCWGMNRRRRRDLEAPVAAILGSDDAESARLRRFGFKNRLLVLREERGAAVRYEGEPGFSLPALRDSASGTDRGSIENALAVLPIAAMDGAKTAKIGWMRNEPVGPERVLPFVEGASYVGPGVTLRMGRPYYVEYADQRYMLGFSLPRRMAWHASLDVKIPEDAELRLELEPLDRDGRPIRDLDVRGRPRVSERSADLARQANGPLVQWWRSPIYPPSITSLVDPESLSGVRWRVSLDRRIPMPPFPLDAR